MLLLLRFLTFFKSKKRDFLLFCLALHVFSNYAFDPKIWCIHLCPKLHQGCKSGDKKLSKAERRGSILVVARSAFTLRVGHVLPTSNIKHVLWTYDFKQQQWLRNSLYIIDLRKQQMCEL